MRSTSDKTTPDLPGGPCVDRARCAINALTASGNGGSDADTTWRSAPPSWDTVRHQWTAPAWFRQS